MQGVQAASRFQAPAGWLGRGHTHTSLGELFTTPALQRVLQMRKQQVAECPISSTVASKDAIGIRENGHYASMSPIFSGVLAFEPAVPFAGDALCLARLANFSWAFKTQLQVPLLL